MTRKVPSDTNEPEIIPQDDSLPPTSSSVPIDDIPRDIPSRAEYEATGNDITQVRDLLFGTQNREYERRFRTLDRQNETLTATVQRLTERLDRMDIENVQLRERIRDQHVQLQSRLEEMQLAIHNRLEDIQRLLIDRLRTHQNDTETRFEEIQTTLLQTFDDLDTSKVDQQQLADMIMDLALRIKRNVRPATHATQRLIED